MTTFWVGIDGKTIIASSDPDATPVGAITSTEVPPDSAKHQTWNDTTWEDNTDRVDQEQLSTDTVALREAGKNIALVLVELVDWLLANTAMQATDFTPDVKQAYLDLKDVADRVKS